MEPKNELQWNAIHLARRKELESYQRELDIQWLNSRMEDGRMGRCLALIQREAEMEKDFQERTDHAAIVNARAAKETALGIEIAKLRREEACQLLRRQYLRERDPSLRVLMTKLQAGYVCRDLQMQIQNNKYRKLQEEAEEKRANSILRNAIYNDEDVKEREEKEKMESTSAYRKELQQQLVNRELQRQCQYEDSLIEKKMLEDIMRTIADEDQRELELKRATTERLRREMETFKRARDAWKLKQKEMVVLEEREIEKQKAAAADRSSAIVAERERKVRLKEELNQKIVSKILADEAAREERDNIIKTLQEQEVFEKSYQDDAAKREKMERCRRDTMHALSAQLRARRAAACARADREAQFRLQMEAKIEAEKQKEIERAMKKREEARKYSEELLQQIQDNARRRERDRRMEEDRAKYVWDCDKAWREEVAKERAEIIKEHAPPLLGYLQASVITPEDLPTVRAGANQREDLSKLNIEALETSTKPHRFPKCNAQCMVLREY